MKKKLLHLCCPAIFCFLRMAAGLNAQAIEWAKSIELVDNELAAGISQTNDVETDANGNIYLAGQFAGTHDFGGGPVTASGNIISTIDGFIAKYDQTGNFIWLETFPAFLGGVEDVEVDGEGNIYLLANFENQITIGGTDVEAGDNDEGVAFAKLNADRELQWVSSVMQVNTFNTVFGRTLDVGDDGRVFVTGIFTGTLTVGGNQIIASASEGSNFLAALNGDTGFWEFSMAVAKSSPLSTRLDVTVDGDGNIFLAGTSIGTSDFGGTVVTAPDEQFAFLAKYDAGGNLLWVRHSAGSSGSFSDETAAVEVASTGEVYIGGSFGSQTFLLSGMTLLNPDACCSEFFVAKFNTDGDLLWVRQSQGPFATEFELSDITLSENGSVTATGVYINPMGSTIALGQTTLPQGPGDNVFVVNYSAAGDMQWARGVFAESTTSMGIASAGNGSVILTGVFTGEFQLDGTTLQSVPQDFDGNMYFLKINSMLNDLIQVTEQQRLSAYPNPANTFLQIETPHATDSIWLRLIDVSGQQILKETTAGITTKIKLPKLVDGTYFLLLENTEGVIASEKIIIKK